MATPDHIRTHQVTESLPPNIAPIQAGETLNFPRLRRDVYSTRNAAPPCPRIPRLVSKNAKPATSTLDSQFLFNASHVQKPLSLITHVSFFVHQTFFTPQLTAYQNESAEKSGPVSAAVRRNPMFKDKK